MRPRGAKEAKKVQKGQPRGAPREAKGAQKGHGGHRPNRRVSLFGAPGPPKGSKIFEKAAMLAANCKQDWKDWMPGI